MKINAFLDYSNHRGCGIARLGAALAALALAGCVAPPPRYYYRELPPPQPRPLVRPAESRPLYFYPAQGQDAARVDRDRYECYRWAVQQTGLEPGMSPLGAGASPEPLPPTQPDGVGTVTGAATGAVVGSVMAGRHHSAEGLVFGAILGAALGASSDLARADAEDRRRQAQAQRAQQQRTDLSMLDFRRAMSACMTARGYSVN
jgi:hypothetical protein